MSLPFFVCFSKKKEIELWKVLKRNEKLKKILMLLDKKAKICYTFINRIIN